MEKVIHHIHGQREKHSSWLCSYVTWKGMWYLSRGGWVSRSQPDNHIWSGFFVLLLSQASTAHFISQLTLKQWADKYMCLVLFRSVFVQNIHSHMCLFEQYKKKCLPHRYHCARKLWLNSTSPWSTCSSNMSTSTVLRWSQGNYKDMFTLFRLFMLEWKTGAAQTWREGICFQSDTARAIQSATQSSRTRRETFWGLQRCLDFPVFQTTYTWPRRKMSLSSKFEFFGLLYVFFLNNTTLNKIWSWKICKVNQSVKGLESNCKVKHPTVHTLWIWSSTWECVVYGVRPHLRSSRPTKGFIKWTSLQLKVVHLWLKDVTEVMNLSTLHTQNVFGSKMPRKCNHSKSSGASGVCN